MTRWARSCLNLHALSLAALLAGCAGSFQTTEITRPLTVDLTLQSEQEVEAMEAILTRYAAYDRAAWLSKTRNALAFVTVFKYDESMFQLRDLVEVLEKTPENAHAWVYMGIYLALQHQPQAAIEASEAGVRVLDQRRAQTPLHPAERQLRSVALLNIALYHLPLDQYRQSLSALARIENPDELDGFRRTAYYWISTQAYSALRRIEEARTALAAARRITPEELKLGPLSMNRFNYPQYFDSGREASSKYLEGVIALDSQNGALAIKRFDEALKIKPDMWEARFARVNAASATNTNLARRYLSDLLEELPGNGYYSREVLYYAFANLEFSTNRLNEAEHYYGLAIREAEKRNNAYIDAWRRRPVANTPPGQIIARTLSPAQQGFPEAQNNLAFLYLERMMRGRYPPDESREMLQKADTLLRAAIANPTYITPYIAQANLARVYAMSGRWDDFLAGSAEAMRLKPQYTVTLKQLVFAAEGRDIESASQAYALFLDALLVLRGYPGFDEEFRPQLRHVAERLGAPLAGPEQLRALGRLYALTGDNVARAKLFAQARSRFPEEPFTRVAQAQAALEKDDFLSAERSLDAGLARSLESNTPMAKADQRDFYYTYARIGLARCERDPQKPCPRDQIAANLDKAQAITPGWMPTEVSRSLIAARGTR